MREQLYNYNLTKEIDMEIISQTEIIQASKLEEAVINCKNRFSDITEEILSINTAANEVEKSIFKYLMELGAVPLFPK